MDGKQCQDGQPWEQEKTPPNRCLTNVCYRFSRQQPRALGLHRVRVWW